MKRAGLVLVLLALGACSSTSDGDKGGTPDAAGPNPSCETYGHDASANCVQPCNPGNELRVGEFCTAGGPQCDDNLEAGLNFAFICTSTVQADSDGFCTRSCMQDSQCGTNAVCRGDPGQDGGQKGCVPIACM